MHRWIDRDYFNVESTEEEESNGHSEKSLLRLLRLLVDQIRIVSLELTLEENLKTHYFYYTALWAVVVVVVVIVLGNIARLLLKAFNQLNTFKLETQESN